MQIVHVHSKMYIKNSLWSTIEGPRFLSPQELSSKIYMIYVPEYLDKQSQELVPLFRVYTILDPGNSNWNIIHDPTHDELKSNL